MQPSSTATATIDTQNPFYCPSLSATAYLRNLRQSLLPNSTNSRNGGGLFSTFARMLDQCGLTVDSDPASVTDFVYNAEHDWIVGVNFKHRRARRGPQQPDTTVTSSGGSDGQQSDDSPSMDVDEFTLSGIPPKLQSTVIQEQQRATKRKRTSSVSSSSSDLGPPKAKFAKSDLTANDSSFEIEVRHKTVNFDVTGSEPTLPVLQDEGSDGDGDSTLHAGDATALDALLKRVSTLLPGMRIEERLSKIPELDVQKTADFLAQNGYLNHTVLNEFRKTGVFSLSLGFSLYDEEGLNICGPDVIRTLGKPYTFLSLTELSFSECRVEDFDLVNLHHLPKLSVLYLNNTGIGNEAVYLLVPLKRTMKRLSLAINPDVTSESTPALLLLSNLEFLSLCDTGVDMNGLRLIARTIVQENRTIDIEIPYACEEYIDRIESMYLVDIQPPLISSPDECSSLTVATLKKNLAAHAEKNPAIAASGTKMEMVLRLKEILARRQMDLVVAQMLLGA